MNTPSLHSPAKHMLSPFLNHDSSSDKFQKKGIDKKLLTPCRRVGLKRKSLSSVKGIQHSSGSMPESRSATNTSCTSKRPYFSVDSDNLNCTEQNFKVSKSGLVCSVNIELENTVHDTNANSCASATFSSVNQLCYNKCMNKDIPSKQKSLLNTVKLNDNMKIKPESITIAVLDSLATSIRDKREKFKRVELTNRYAKKHDLKMLEELTLKWKKGCQDALYELQTLLHGKGHNLSMAAILNQFHIPFDVMQFNEDNDEFD